MAEEVWTDPRFHGRHIVSSFEFENVALFLRANCSLEAKYCHKCGDLLKQNGTEGAGSVDEGSKKMKVAANLVPLEATGFFCRSQVTFSLLLNVLTCIRTPPCFSTVLSISTDGRRKASASSLREVGYFFP